MKEIWRQVVGYEGLYEVSNLGTVSSSRHGRNTYVGKVIKHRAWAGRMGGGYHTINLYDYCSGVQRLHVHNIVTAAFMGRPGPDYVIWHTNGDKSDNSVKNLSWVTKEEYKRLKWKRDGRTKLSPDDVEKIRKIYALGGVTQKQLAKMYGVCHQRIGLVLNRKVWADI